MWWPENVFVQWHFQYLVCCQTELAFLFFIFFIAVNLSREKKREFSWDTFFSFPALNNPIIFGFMLVFASIAIVRFLSQSDFSILMVRKKNMFHYDWL